MTPIYVPSSISNGPALGAFTQTIGPWLSVQAYARPFAPPRGVVCLALFARYPRAIALPAGVD